MLLIEADVVEVSGIGPLDRVATDAFLSDKEVGLDAVIDVFTEGFFGSAATSDLETFFQLIHLAMTEPRLDPVAVEQYIDTELPLAEVAALAEGDFVVHAEHGIGRFKTDDLVKYGDPAKLTAMRAIKAALDPAGGIVVKVLWLRTSSNIISALSLSTARRYSFIRSS